MAHLSVGGLHMRNIRVSLREPLQALPTSPASGHMGPALLLGLFPRTVGVFHGAVPLLLWDGMRILVPINIVCLYAAALYLRVRVSCMNTLQKSEEGRLSTALEKRRCQKICLRVTNGPSAETCGTPFIPQIYAVYTSLSFALNLLSMESAPLPTTSYV